MSDSIPSTSIANVKCRAPLAGRVACSTHSDLSLFWALDGGVEMTKLFIDYGADVNARSPKDWTPLSYAQAKGKYGATEEKVESVSLYTLHGIHTNESN